MNLQLGRAWSILMQTGPYLVYRAVLYGALAFAALAYLGFLCLVGSIFGVGAAVVLFFVTWIGGRMLGLGRLVGEYILYMLKAGHVALVVEIIENGALPAGISQTSWAKERVLAQVKEVSVLALLDQLVRGVIRFVNREVVVLSTRLPIPGIDGAARGAGRIVELSVTYVDEAMLAYAFKTKNPNVLDAAKKGVVLYCQCWKGLLANAVAVAIAGYLLAGLLFLAFAIPFGGLALSLPPAWAASRFVLFALALALAFWVKLVVYDPLACTATILTFFAESEGMEPSPEWEARLEGANETFRELQARAAAFVGGTARQSMP